MFKTLFASIILQGLRGHSLVLWIDGSRVVYSSLYVPPLERRFKFGNSWIPACLTIYIAIDILKVPTPSLHSEILMIPLGNISLLIASQQNRWKDCGNMYIIHRHMNVEIGAEAAPFPEKEYIKEIFFAVYTWWNNVGPCVPDGTCTDLLFFLEDWEGQTSVGDGTRCLDCTDHRGRSLECWPWTVSWPADYRARVLTVINLLSEVSWRKRRGRLDLHFNGRLKGRPLPAKSSEAAKLQASAHSICWYFISICTPVITIITNSLQVEYGTVHHMLSLWYWSCRKSPLAYLVDRFLGEISAFQSEGPNCDFIIRLESLTRNLSRVAALNPYSREKVRFVQKRENYRVLRRNRC